MTDSTMPDLALTRQVRRVTAREVLHTEATAETLHRFLSSRLPNLDLVRAVANNDDLVAVFVRSVARNDQEVLRRFVAFVITALLYLGSVALALLLSNLLLAALPLALFLVAFRWLLTHVAGSDSLRTRCALSLLHHAQGLALLRDEPDSGATREDAARRLARAASFTKEVGSSTRRRRRRRHRLPMPYIALQEARAGAMHDALLSRMPDIASPTTDGVQSLQKDLCRAALRIFTWHEDQVDDIARPGYQPPLPGRWARVREWLSTGATEARGPLMTSVLLSTAAVMISGLAATVAAVRALV